MNASVWTISGTSPSGEKGEVKAVFCNPSPLEDLPMQEVTVKSFFETSSPGLRLFKSVSWVDWISNSFTLEADRVIKPFNPEDPK